MPRQYSCRRRVEFRDTDAAGIAHFSVFFAYMEQAEHHFWRTVGTSVLHRETDDSGNAVTYSWPRVSAKCDYLRPLRFEDEVTIAMTVSKVGTKSLTLDFDFLHHDDKVAAGQLVTVCCIAQSDHSLRSIAIPDSLREILNRS